MMPDSLPFLAAAEIRAVPMLEMIDAVEGAFRDVASGADRSPMRSHVALDGGDLLLMPGLRAGASGFTVKLVTVVASNADRGLPTVQAVVVWFDAETGSPVALIDGSTLTAMRTGAASGVGTRLLARPEASSAALIGGGAQAEWQLRAICAVRPIRRVAVYARSSSSREAFAERMTAETGLEVMAVASAREALADAEVVCCATTATEPVFEAEWLASGAHVNGIGAFRLGMVELPPQVFGAAALVAVDSRAASMAEAGDVVAAVEAGLLTPGDLVEIGSVAAEWAGNERGPREITVFKSVGLAIQDVAAAELIVRRLIG